MKLCEIIPALQDPRRRRLLALRAAMTAAALEGMEEIAEKNRLEIDKIQKEIAFTISQEADQKSA